MVMSSAATHSHDRKQNELEHVVKGYDFDLQHDIGHGRYLIADRNTGQPLAHIAEETLEDSFDTTATALEACYNAARRMNDTSKARHIMDKADKRRQDYQRNMQNQDQGFGTLGPQHAAAQPF